MKDSGEVQLWSTDGLLLGSLSLQTDVIFISRHLDHITRPMFNTGSKWKVTSKVLICVFLGDMHGLLSYYAIRSCWNSFRKRALRWPEEGAAASAGAGEPSPPLCGSFSASISICCKSKPFWWVVCFSSVFFFYSFDQEGHYLFAGASDSHVFVLNAKPSERFSLIGYTGRYCFWKKF